MQDAHLSDQALLQLAEDDTSCQQSTAETHISECRFCQERLVELAAGADLRAEIQACLTKEASWTLRSDFPKTLICPESNSSSKSPDYERAALHQMLASILGPARHPETLGSLDRYEIERVIGVGGMGFVARGYDAELQRPVAIKFILPGLLQNGTVKQRFLREARAAASILHPNVIAIHGLGEQGNVPWFSMPLIAGPTLRELVEANGPLCDGDVVRIAKQLASGLSAAHRQGLVHRDIKPENILIDNHVNRVVLTDFGLARRDCDRGLTKTGGLNGTLSFMSPEQIRGDDIDGRSDLFSLGSVLYYLATGEQPFQADSPMTLMNRITTERHPDPRTRNPDVSGSVVLVINQLLQKDPAHRFPSAIELEHHLEKLLSHLNNPVQHPAPSLPQSGISRRRVRFGAAFGMACSLVLLLVLVRPVLFPEDDPHKSAIDNSEVTWQDIQRKYDLSAVDEFQQQFHQLQMDVLALDQKFQSNTSGDELLRRNEHFPQVLSQLNDQMDQLDATLNQW